MLVKEFSINEGLAAKFKDTHARVFDVGPGGNACDGWPAVVTVDKDGKVAIDKRMRHKGRFKLLEQAPRNQLVLEMDSKDLGTYRFLLIAVSDKEIVLEPSVGNFTVYRRP